jgi:DnaK suppressor protein
MCGLRAVQHRVRHIAARRLCQLSVTNRESGLFDETMTRSALSRLAPIYRLAPVPSGNGQSMTKIMIDEGYRPSDDEPFMNDRQREYFRRKLIRWKGEILREAQETFGDPAERKRKPPGPRRPGFFRNRPRDRASRPRRQRKLIAKIDSALSRIEDGTYGYCEETGEPIALRRLEARPIATLSLEAQERHERNERVYRDD